MTRREHETRLSAIRRQEQREHEYQQAKANVFGSLLALGLLLTTGAILLLA